MSDLKMSCYVKKYKSFNRKNGHVGQEIVVRNPEGYSVSLAALDKEIMDLSKIPTGCDVELILEPDFTFIKGEKYYQNILQLMCVGFISDDIVMD